MESVIGLFVEDHGRIAHLLQEFKKLKKDKSKKSKEIFKQLDFSLKKHFKEEELLYTKYKQKTGEIIPVLKTIRKEHGFLLEHLSDISVALNGSSKVSLNDFYGLLERHKNIEERLLYPELENVLSEKEREEVYWHIKVK